ncbi:MAG: DUF975 family protein [Ruminococcaceae bacterium]|nr:DUF975 family protein [Oscillospiraceae bacterium]
MINRKELKTKAKAVLSRSYFMIFLACLAVTLVSGGGTGLNLQKLQNIDPSQISNVKLLLICGIIGILTIIGILFFILLVSPLYVGLKKFILNTSKGSCNLEDLLFPFKNNYKNITFTVFMKNLYIFLWSLPSFIPLVLGITVFDLPDTVMLLVQRIQADSVPAALTLIALSTLLMLLTIIFSIPSIIKDLQYSMVQYILADDPDTNWKTAIAKSKEMMVGNKWEYVKLMFSFTGWYLLCNLACCLGNFVLTPYIETTFAQMYIEISGQSSDYQQNSYNENNFFRGFGSF